MCESTIYSTKKPGDALMKDVVMVTAESDRINMIDVLGSEKTLHGKIVKIDLLNHTLYIEEH